MTTIHLQFNNSIIPMDLQIGEVTWCCIKVIFTVTLPYSIMRWCPKNVWLMFKVRIGKSAQEFARYGESWFDPIPPFAHLKDCRIAPSFIVHTLQFVDSLVGFKCASTFIFPTAFASGSKITGACMTRPLLCRRWSVRGTRIRASYLMSSTRCTGKVAEWAEWVKCDCRIEI